MIELSWPPRALHPNSRSHWAIRARAARKARADAAWATKAARVGIAAGDVPILLNICFCPPDRRHRDLDGMLSSLKSSLDGIADALGVNDKWFRPSLAIGDTVKGGRVLVTIT